MPLKKYNLKSNPCFFLVGPTASGKTQILKSLAEYIPLEVISCDSMQVYRGMAIMSGAPSSEDLKSVPHHLIQCLDVHDEFNAARFIEEATALCNQVISRNKIPIVAGGTGLYMKSLLDGVFKGPGENAVIREKLYQRAELEGSEKLHQELRCADASSAKKIHPNDTRRIVRALEVIQVTGKAFSELKKDREGIWGTRPIGIWGLRRNRENLYSRINRRVDEMFEQGFVCEAKALLTKDLSKTAQGCLGIKEIQLCETGELTLDKAKDLIKQHTRQYAKRQMSWFNQDKRIDWIDVDENSSNQNIAVKIIEKIDAILDLE